jgi:hypothetical protein
MFENIPAERWAPITIWTHEGRFDYPATHTEPPIQTAEQDVALNTCPAASSIRHDHSTFNPQSKPRPRAGVRGLDDMLKICDFSYSMPFSS